MAMERSKGFIRTFASSRSLGSLELSFTHSPWWLVAGGLAAAALTLAAYYRNERLMMLPLWARRLGAACRFLALFLLAFLLTGPLVRLKTTREEKPQLLFLTDNSASMLMHADSQWVRMRLAGLLDSLKRTLSSDFEVVSYVFGSQLEPRDSLNFSASSSHYDRAFREAIEALDGRRLRGMVLTGDGRFNEGPSPIYAARRLGLPVFCLMTGDTLSIANAALADVAYNQVTLTGNRFPVEVTLSFQKMQGRRAMVELRDENGKTVDKKEVSIPSVRHTEQVILFHTTEKTGLMAYSVVVTAGKETYEGDNVRRFFIESVGNRHRILIAADAPHPDVGALRLTLSRTRNLELTVAVGENLPENARDFNLVVFHQVPGIHQAGLKLLSNVIEEKIPFWLITGPNTRAQALQQYATGLTFGGLLPGRMDEFYASLNTAFSAFEISQGLRDFLKQLPPLESPFGNYQMPAPGEVLFYRRVGQTISTMPMVGFVHEAGTRRLLWVGTGLWRWRMVNYEKFQNFQYFEELMDKIVQYLSMSDDKSRFRLKAPTLLEEGQKAFFRAELYNPAYEPVTHGAVSLTLKDSIGRSFSYSLTPGKKFYELDAGALPPGKYTYEARALLGQDVFSKTGMLVVEAADRERRTGGSDFGTLTALSNETNGVAVPVHQAGQLPDLIKDKCDSRRITWTESSVHALIHQKLWFFLLVALLTAEWVLRKYFGSY